MKKYCLRLYITGQSSHSLQAVKNLDDVCKTDLQNEYEIEVIDVLEHPQLAEDEKILATPTLVKQLPTPLRKLVGDLSNRENMLMGLDLVPARNRQEEK